MKDDMLPLTKRQITNRLNRQKRREVTPEGRKKLRETALKHRPWEHATGPRTAAGKVRCARNGKSRQVGILSIPEMRAISGHVYNVVKEMAALRQTLIGSGE